MAQPRLRTALAMSLLLAWNAAAARHHLLIVSGIGGTDEFSQQFARRAGSLYQSGLDADIDPANIHLLSAQQVPQASGRTRAADKATLLRTIDEIGASAGTGDMVFIVLVGHGNPRGDGAVFNLPGPDISAAELAAKLAGFTGQTLVVVNTASASGPFVRALSGDNRVIITATSSGREYHATLFGEYFVAALADAGADRDKDQRISMLEAFDYARREVRREFDSEKRLLTEHALLDDNGDGVGSLEPGEFAADGEVANRTYLQQPRSLATGADAEMVAMLERKRDIEIAIGNLKKRRENMSSNVYYDELEVLLVDLALLSRKIRMLQ
ncbi:MAG: C13 family peptidase [Gammaproteobacteria bacterium]|nr:C13 family peptidase [Gammaproteobacteria bacterium]